MGNNVTRIKRLALADSPPHHGRRQGEPTWISVLVGSWLQLRGLQAAQQFPFLTTCPVDIKLSVRPGHCPQVPYYSGLT